MNLRLVKEFANDLKDLYCKTRVSAVEDCFIKLSQYSEKIDALDFISWLNAESRSKGKSSVLQNLSEPDIIDAFKYLYSINSRFRALQNNSEQLRKEIFNVDPHIIEIVATMRSFIDDASVKSILEPFSHSIQLVCSIFSPEPYNADMIKRDLGVLVSAYSRRLTQKENDLKSLFGFLLNKFSYDVGKALTDIGRQALADKIINGKILFRPDLLSQVLSVGHIDYVMGDKIRDMLSKISYMSQSQESVYNYIKRDALDFVGTIDKKQHEPKRQQDIMDKDLEGLQQGKGLLQPSSTPMDITKEQWLQPRSLAIISATLYALYRHILGFK